ncbi:MAG: hypothetical protein M1835_002451 [Candelina submexicana]|nr:MAG: hypothetical protein M1835_002451 [Candelina submexicana]
MSGNHFAAKRFYNPSDAIKKEIALLKRASHQHIVQFIETDSDHGDLMVIMEIIEGGTIEDLEYLDADTTVKLA